MDTEEGKDKNKMYVQPILKKPILLASYSRIATDGPARMEIYEQYILQGIIRVE